MVILLVLNICDMNNSSLLMQSVSLGTDLPPSPTTITQLFFPLHALKILTSLPCQTKKPLYTWLDIITTNLLSYLQFYPIIIINRTVFQQIKGIWETALLP